MDWYSSYNLFIEASREKNSKGQTKTQFAREVSEKSGISEIAIQNRIYSAKNETYYDENLVNFWKNGDVNGAVEYILKSKIQRLYHGKSKTSFAKEVGEKSGFSREAIRSYLTEGRAVYDENLVNFWKNGDVNGAVKYILKNKGYENYHGKSKSSFAEEVGKKSGLASGTIRNYLTKGRLQYDKKIVEFWKNGDIDGAVKYILKNKSVEKYHGRSKRQFSKEVAEKSQKSQVFIDKHFTS